jgi:hypothetical protein
VRFLRLFVLLGVLAASLLSGTIYAAALLLRARLSLNLHRRLRCVLALSSVLDRQRRHVERLADLLPGPRPMLLDRKLDRSLGRPASCIGSTLPSSVMNAVGFCSA